MSSPSFLQLEKILHVGIDKMQQLLQLLYQESEILTTNNIDALAQLTNEKILLSEEIEENEKRRIHFLDGQSLDSNKPEQWLKTNNLVSLWNEMKNIVIESKKQNQINGIVINRSRHRVETQIEILKTSSLPSVDLVYSASGEGVKQRTSTTLVRA